MTTIDTITGNKAAASGDADGANQTIVDPAGQLEGARNRLSPRSPNILDGAVIGVLHNSKPNGDVLM